MTVVLKKLTFHLNSMDMVRNKITDRLWIGGGRFYFLFLCEKIFSNAYPSNSNAPITIVISMNCSIGIPSNFSKNVKIPSLPSI